VSWVPLEVLRPGKADFEGTVQAPSIIVWVDGGVAYAKDTRTGRMIAESSDHASVIQAALNALAQTGGAVLLRRGTYYLAASISVPAYCALVGEGPENTKLVFTTASGDGIVLPDGDARVLIEGFTVANTRASIVSGSAAIRFANTDGSQLRRVKVTGYWDVGIVLDNAVNNVLEDVEASSGSAAKTIATGLFIVNTSNSNVIIKLRTGGCDYGVLFFTQSPSGNVLIAPDVGYTGAPPRSGSVGIYVRGNDNVLLAPWLEQADTGIVDEGTRTVVVRPSFYDVNTKIFNAYATNPRYIGTPDMQNFGTATIPAGQASATVSHGLIKAPRLVIVTPAGNLGAVWVSNITSTSFTINCSTAPTTDTVVYWYAEV
jgi:hypothetical protein